MRVTRLSRWTSVLRSIASAAGIAAITGLPVAFLASSPPAAFAAEADDEFTAIKARLDSLERENAELRAVIRNPNRLLTQVSPVNAEAGTEDTRIRSVVQEYLEEQKAKEKAAEELKKQAAAEAGYEVGSDLTMTAKWNNGLELSTKNKDFRIHIGGRTQYDGGAFWAPDNVQNNINQPYQNGVDFRRARLRIDGTMYEQQEFAVEYDFINSNRFVNSVTTGPGGAPPVTSSTGVFDVTAFTDVWWQLKELPVVGNLRIGNQKEAIGFEHIVSSRFLPFMERSYNQDTFYGGSFNGFTPGVAIFDSYGENSGTWNIGVYKPTSNVFAYNAHTGDYAVTGRVTRLLWNEADGAELLHVGLGARQYTSVNNTMQFRTRDAIRTGASQVWPVPADTGTLLANAGQFLDPEIAAVHGPWTFQAEYLGAWTEDVAKKAGDATRQVFYQGGYVQAFYFLTGEHDSYDYERGSFGRVKPRENFFLLRTEGGTAGGWGAWQIGARYNYLNLNSNGINGGELNNYTVGLNWFWNPNMKVQFNYMLTDRNSAAANGLGDGVIHGIGMRFAHDF
jgi:phosphate-selective porin OprO/OprP